VQHCVSKRTVPCVQTLKPIARTPPATRFDRRYGRDRVFLKARWDLARGQEVFVSYGNGYWHARTRPLQGAACTPAAAVGSKRRHQQTLRAATAAAAPQQQQQLLAALPAPQMRGGSSSSTSGGSSSSTSGDCTARQQQPARHQQLLHADAQQEQQACRWPCLAQRMGCSSSTQRRVVHQQCACGVVQ
jgi:hypothetical protein